MLAKRPFVNCARKVKAVLDENARVFAVAKNDEDSSDLVLEEIAYKSIPMNITHNIDDGTQRWHC